MEKASANLFIACSIGRSKCDIGWIPGSGKFVNDLSVFMALRNTRYILFLFLPLSIHLFFYLYTSSE